METATNDNPADLFAIWGEAISMASLHACRTELEAAEAMTLELERLVPGADMALCLASGLDSRKRVDLIAGETCPWAVGDEVALSSWQVPEEQKMPVRYRDHELGTLVVGRPIEDEERALLAAMLAHYGVAIVNLTLNAESRNATDNYCASLQALEEGIVLFQEEDGEAVQARLLSLASSMLHATAAALYVLRDVGNADSGLELKQVLGIPESLLEGFESSDGTAWPQGLLSVPTELHVLDADGGLAGLAPASLPPILQNIVSLPLRYHGVEAGICILFNSTIDASNSKDHIGRVHSLGQLGAALLHRLQLESMAAHSRAIARELQIAETIQKRLIPATAPETGEYEFAWSSIAAQHIGGDYLDLVSSDLGDIHAVVADVSGHGINSALLMSSFRSTYRGDAPWTEPGDLAGSLNNEVVHEVGATGMFITAVVLRLEQGTRQMTMTSAGHNPVYIYRADTDEVEEVDSDGPPLGFLGDAKYGEKTFTLAPQDVVLLYTDGVTEATNADLDMYEEERLIAVLRENAGRSADDIISAVQTSLVEFTGSERQDDDVSILVIKAS